MINSYSMKQLTTFLTQLCRVLILNLCFICVIFGRVLFCTGYGMVQKLHLRFTTLIQVFHFINDNWLSMWTLTTTIRHFSVYLLKLQPNGHPPPWNSMHWLLNVVCDRKVRGTAKKKTNPRVTLAFHCGIWELFY